MQAVTPFDIEFQLNRMTPLIYRGKECHMKKSWKKLFYEKRTSEYRQKAFEAGEMKKPNFDDSHAFNYIVRDISKGTLLFIYMRLFGSKNDVSTSRSKRCDVYRIR